MKLTIRGTPEEIAALVVAIQERQGNMSFTPVDVMKEAVQQAMRDIERVVPQ